MHCKEKITPHPRTWSYYHNWFLLCELAVNEGDCLCTSAGIIGCKDGRGLAVGDAVFDSPHNCIVAVGVCSNVVKLCKAAYDGGLLIAPQEGDYLAASADCIRVKGGSGLTGGNAVFDSPHNSIVVSAVFAHIGERVLNVLDLRLACRAIQEGDYLSASAAVVNAEYSVGNAVGNAVAVCPQDRVIVRSLLDIGERVVAGLLCVAAGADALNIVVAESLDFGALSMVCLQTVQTLSPV